MPLDDADVAAQPQTLGPGLGVRDQEAGHQAEQRHHGEQRPWPAGVNQMARPANTPRRDPVEGRVEERAPGAAGALHPGQHAVEHVEEHEDRAREGAREQLARGEQGERAGQPRRTVPMTVIAFGVTGVRASTLPAGVNRRVIAGRSTFSMAVRILPPG